MPLRISLKRIQQHAYARRNHPAAWCHRLNRHHGRAVLRQHFYQLAGRQLAMHHVVGHLRETEAEHGGVCHCHAVV